MLLRCGQFVISRIVDGARLKSRIRRHFKSALVLSCLANILPLSTLHATEIEKTPTTFDANNRDYQTFLYSLGLSAKTASEESSTSPLYQLAQREMLADGLTPEELYEKFALMLTKVEANLRKLFLVNRQLAQGDHAVTSTCFEIGCSASLGLGFGLRVLIGLRRTPRTSYPVVGLKFRRLPFSIGANLLELGFDTKTFRTANNVEIFSSEYSGAIDLDQASSFLISTYYGRDVPYHSVEDPKQSHPSHMWSRGIAFGLNHVDYDLRQEAVRLPIKIPVYVFNYEKELATILKEVATALYYFDFERAENQIEKFNNAATAVWRKLAQRGLVLADTNREAPPLQEHLFLSPGIFFHPRRLLRYAPATLIPDNMQALACEIAGNSKDQSTLLLGF